MLRFVFCLFLALAPEVAVAQQLHSYTNMSHSSQHGTQVNYLARDGQSFLWYPGNTMILSGQWKREGQNMCFAYGSNTYNPATGHRGGGWECMPFDIYWRVVSERMEGDIFSLQTRQEVPFRLRMERTSLTRLLSRVSPRSESPPVELAVTSPGGRALTLSCESILANAERSKDDAFTAVGTYFYGIFMGEPCVDVDYDRAYALANRAGISFEPWARVLRERAESGNPRAISAIRRLGL